MENQDKNTPVMSTVITPTPQGPGVSNGVPIVSQTIATPVPTSPQSVNTLYEAPIMPNENSLESNPQAVSSQPASPAPTATVTTTEPIMPTAKKPLVNKALLVIGAVALVIVVAVALLTGVLSNRRAGELQSPAQSVNEQGVTLGDASPEVLSVLKLQGSENKLIVNGDIITSGRVSMAGGNYYGQFVVNNLTANREYVLPDASGSFCLSSNNCNYLTDFSGQSGSIALGAGLSMQGNTLVNSQTQTTINNISGGITIQGTANQVNVAANGSVITLTTPQDIATTSAPTFAGVTISGSSASFNGVAYSLPALQGTGVLLNDGSGGLTWSNVAGACATCILQQGNSFGADLVIGTNDNYNINFETNGTNKVQITSAGAVHVGSAPAFIGVGLSVTSTQSGSSCAFGCWGVYSNSTFSHNALMSNIGGGRLQYTTTASTPVTRGFGLYIGNPSLGAGSTVAENYGLFVESLASGTTDFGVRIDAADTQTLWLSGNANNTTANAGIAFGSSRDTNLYRSAADTLRTDDSFSVGTNLTVQGTAAIGNGIASAYVPTFFGTTPILAVHHTATGAGTTIGSSMEVSFDPVAPGTNGGYVSSILATTPATNAQTINLLGGGVVGAIHRGSGPVSTALGLVTQIGNEGSGIMGSAIGIQVAGNYNSGTGSILTSIGIQVDSQTFSSATDATGISIGNVSSDSGDAFGLIIGEVTSNSGAAQALWLQSDAGNAANGIAFGSTRDTNLYRSAADTLRTDDTLSVGGSLNVTSDVDIAGHLAVGGSASVSANNVITVSETFTANSGTYTGSSLTVTTDPTAASTMVLIGSLSAAKTAAGDPNGAGLLIGSQSRVDHEGSGTLNSAFANYNYIGTGASSGPIGNAIAVIGQVDNFSASTYTSAIGVAGIVKNAGSGTITAPSGVLGQVIGEAGTLVSASGMTIQNSITNSGNITTSYGLTVANPTDTSSGSITNNYGIHVEPMTTGATLDFGVAIGAADTQTLWLSNNADNTTANAGIAFGSSRDTNLYRSAADLLRTDDSLHVGTKVQIGADATVGSIGQCNQILGFANCTVGLEVGTNSTETANSTFGISNLTYLTPSGATNTAGGRASYNVLILGGTQSVSGNAIALDGFAINSTTAGTVSMLNGTTGFASQTGPGSTVTLASGVRAGVSQQNGTLTTGIGLDVLSAVGTIGTTYGIRVQAQTVGTTDYGVAIEAADTQTLWVSSNADNTTANAGIAFGLSRDTNLYRSAANTLRTDDLLQAAGGLSSPGSGTNSERFGSGATAVGTGSIAIGNNAATTNDGSIAIGYQSSATLRSTTIGTNASGAQDGVTIGRAASSSGANSVAVGQSSSTSAANAVALGDSAIAAGSAVALGQGANASASSIALGRGATTTAANQFVVGSSTTPITEFYLGSGVTAASPQSATLRATSGSGSNITGGNMIIAAGQGTGNASSGTLSFQYAAPGTSGSSLNGLSVACTLSGTNGSFGCIGSGSSSTRFGVGTTATGSNSVALGDSADATAGGAVAIGSDTTASAVDAMAIGYNATSAFANSIAIGRGATTTASNQIVFGSNNAPGADLYLGDGVTSASPNNASINATGGSGTDIAGANLEINGGRGTGAAAGGSILFQTSAAGASSSTLRSLSTVFSLAGGTGVATFQNTANSTSALRVLNAAGSTTVLNVDTTNARVGIGTATPGAALEVSGDIYLSKETARTIKLADSTTAATAGAQLSILGANGSSTTSGAGGAIVMTAGAGQAGNSNGGAITITGGASAGIATGGHLNLNGGGGLTGGNVVINAGSGVADGQIRIGSTDGLVALGHANSPSAHLDIRSRVATTDALSVDNVGVVANIAVFKDNGTAVLTVADGGAATFQNATDSTTGFRVLDQDGGVPILNVDTTNERVGIGTATPGFSLDLLSAGADGTTVAQFMNAGATSCTVQPGGTGFSCSSDARLKTNVVTVINPLDTVRQLRGVTFNWNSNPDGEMQVGFIAQELEQLIPSAVSTDGRGYKVANYQAIIPYLVGAAQEQDSRIAGLQQGQTGSASSLTNLNSRVNSLEQRVSALEMQLGTTTGNLASLNVSGPASVQSLTVTGAATIAQLTVTGDARIAGNLTLEGFVLGNESTRGTVTIPAGQTEVKKNFIKPYNAEPNVILTPKNGFAPSYRVEATATDFTVYFQVAAATDIVMNYQIQQ